MAKKTLRDLLREPIQGIDKGLGAIRDIAVDRASPAARSSIDRALAILHASVERTRSEVDGVFLPSGMFNPFDPPTIGRLVVLALLAQPRVPLGDIPDAYGAGIYAIYYQGDHPYYAPISGTETPIYVGKADPKDPDATTPRGQGTSLTTRLREHAKVIRSAEAAADLAPYPIRLIDFACRRLVCASHAQLSAEQHLIRIFWPLWNQETKACWGIGKHGDAATTRANKRSPWDVLHPGRNWAKSTAVQDSMSLDRIRLRIEDVLIGTPPRGDIDSLFREILETFTQDTGRAAGDA